MASLLFYEKIVVLSRERHGDLRIEAGSRDCGFAAATHYIPLVATELYQAAPDYPILFAGGEADGAPVALLGLQEGRNPFIDAAGHWQPGTYLPAFVRRYPFVLARAGDDESAGLTVCIDESHGGFGREQGQRLFNERGSQTEYLANTIQFLQQYQAESERTQAFARRLHELGLLVEKEVRLQDADGHDYVLKDFLVVDAQRLDDLDEGTVIDLHRSGFLGWIHAHLVSMTRLERLPARLAALV